MTTENGSSGSIRVQWGDRTAPQSRIEGPSRRGSMGSVAGLDDEIPTVSAVSTSIRDDVPWLEAPIRLRHAQQATAPTAVNAHDLRSHSYFVHAAALAGRTGHCRSVARAYRDSMRIVGGALGGRRLKIGGADAIRPTSDRAREAMFNILMSLKLPQGATVLDLFAGSGALGFEALSRGAAHATLVDSDAAACRTITTNLTALGVAERATVVRSDVQRYLAAVGDPVDLAFADPPYRFEGWRDLLDSVNAEVLVCESDRPVEPGPRGRWQTHRVRRYGTPVITVLVRPSEADSSAAPD